MRVRFPRAPVLACAALACALVIAGVRALPAHAQPGAAAAAGERVYLSVADCESTAGEAIAKLAALELAPQLEVTTDPAASFRAFLRCGEGRARIVVDAAQGGAPLALELSLAEIAVNARPRLLALALAELVATRRLEGSTGASTAGATSTVQPNESTAAAPLAAAAGRDRLSPWVAAGVLRAYEPGSWSPLFVAGVAYLIPPLERLVLLADVDFAWVAQTTPDASIDARTVSFALASGVHTELGRCIVESALGLRAGTAFLRAKPRAAELEGRAVAGAFVAPHARSALSLRLGARVLLRAEVELGWVLKPVRGLDADGAVISSLEGLRASASIGAALAL